MGRSLGGGPFSCLLWLGSHDAVLSSQGAPWLDSAVTHTAFFISEVYLCQRESAGGTEDRRKEGGEGVQRREQTGVCGLEPACLREDTGFTHGCYQLRAPGRDKSKGRSEYEE